MYVCMYVCCWVSVKFPSLDKRTIYANIGEKDTLFKDREPPKIIPYSAARTYIAHIGE